MVDGFTLNPNLLDLPARYAWDAVQELRRQGNQRQFLPRWHTVPPQMTQTIPARDVFSHQVQLIPGTLVYGVNFYPITGSVNDFQLEIIDTYRDLPVTNQAVFAAAYAVAGSPIRPVLFALPKTVIGSGLWQVKIYNRTAADLQAQMILYCCEPVAGAAI